jgi:hypothetical protein
MALSADVTTGSRVEADYRKHNRRAIRSNGGDWLLLSPRLTNQALRPSLPFRSE